MSVRITGARQLAAAIASLPREFQSTAEFQALGSGAKVIAKNAASRVPVGEGDLKKSIGTNVKGRPGFRTARIGPRAGFEKTVGVISRGPNKGKQRKKKPNNYSHLVEFGTAHSPAKPFIGPAVDQSGGAAFEAMAKGYTKALDRIARKIRKGGKR
jgi:HK97 gp10 family phage protein